jgi:putative hemolysin
MLHQSRDVWQGRDVANRQKCTTFSLNVTGTSVAARAGQAAAPLVERALGLDLLNRYQATCPPNLTPGDYLKWVFETARIHVRMPSDDVLRIPRTGPLIVVSNHPLGAMDGMVLASLLLGVRPDVKFMVNFLLGRVPQLRDLFYFVDPFGGADARRASIAGLRQSVDHVKKGGVLGLFPAGEVSHWHWKRREITDPDWQPMIARIVRMTGAPVLPVFFEGHNSLTFNAAGLIHPRLRTMMLAREMIGLFGKRVNLRIGNVIPNRRLASIEDDESMTEFLRQRTYLLKHRPVHKTKKRRLKLPKVMSLAARRRKLAARTMEPIIDPVSPELIRADVAALPAEQTIMQEGDMSVFHADARQIPSLLREIGRLREITFRATGEGSGKSIDLDRFDEDYAHLCAWSHSRQELVGAYRMGPTDRVLAKKGLPGLYTTTLFEYDHQLLRRISPGIELGRSFVRQEYQKGFQPLLMLWRGILGYAAKNPHYRYVFGPVSISDNYQTVSKTLMVEFLRLFKSPAALADLVMARNPFRASGVRGIPIDSDTPFDADDITDLISEIEPDQKGLPVLLRQYLKMGANLLSFNVDPDFGNCVDGLILVDLAQQNTTLDRYFPSKEARRHYLSHHQSVVAI